jgi:tetratricopeptide (TPR) repeat protein
MILAPSSSILPLYTEIAAERRAYLVVAGLIALAVTGAYAAGRRFSLSLQRAGTARLLRPLAWTAVIAIAATYATLTQARNRDFWSEEQIWRDAVEKRPENSRARVNYGSILSATGRVHEAETQLTEAVRLKPTNAAAHMNLGVVLCTLGRVDEGIAHLERALVLNPELVEAMRDLGEAQATQGRLGPALDQFVRALDRRPDDVFLLNRAAWILATAKDDRLRNGAKAREMAEHAVALTARRDVISLDTLAAAQAETGRFELAVQIAGEALALARSQRNEAIVPEIGQRVMLYSQQRPFRQ